MASRILNRIWNDHSLPPGPRLILLALSEFADEANSCYPSVQTLQRMTSFGESTVRQHLSWLEDNGYIESQRRRRQNGSQTSNRFTFLLDSLQNLDPADAQQPP